MDGFTIEGGVEGVAVQENLALATYAERVKVRNGRITLAGAGTGVLTKGARVRHVTISAVEVQGGSMPQYDRLPDLLGQRRRPALGRLEAAGARHPRGLRRPRQRHRPPHQDRGGPDRERRRLLRQRRLRRLRRDPMDRPGATPCGATTPAASSSAASGPRGTAGTGSTSTARAGAASRPRGRSRAVPSRATARTGSTSSSAPGDDLARDLVLDDSCRGAVAAAPSP